MKILTLMAASAAALTLAACTNPNPEDTETAATMPDTSTAESPAPDAGDTGVAGSSAMSDDPAQSGAGIGAETDQNLPPVDVPEV
ncbi:hypothetical protein [Phenylobacterium sp.]|jgi:hypothetical protein|uniref:hypothetical protein n=1 Tax=Phenylobacterium sp. TaxID=1871053 RepID=UPI000C8E6237|nr:hypothetical protein [Phenylobacterium sp.]MAK81062.1 hypothetical protein [Phenylobacterium sp.]|tara:strand:- start:3520 stop:3774 length:255 start_codon:yes stop_codon:yes gene_type:complete